mgnify:CR=1 FL=1
MRTKLFSVLLILIITVTSFAQVRVVTSINIIEDWLKIIGQDKVTIHTLITGLETPHTYSPRPSDAVALKKADAFIGIGLGLESWLEPLRKSAAKKDLPVFYLANNLELLETEDEHDHGEDNHDHGANPHVWLSLTNAKLMVVELSEILSSIDPANKSFYQKNSQNYLAELNKLKNIYLPKFAALKDKNLVSFPASYPYLFHELGLIELARGEETHGQEPSAKHMVYLTNLMKKNNIKVLVVEKQFSTVLPLTLAKSTGAKPVYLSPLIIDNLSYLQLMESNYLNLLAGFKQ